MKKHICDNKWTLKEPLGPWRIRPDTSDCLWPFYYSHKKNILYRSYRQQWWDHRKYQYDAHQGDDPETFSFQKFKTVTTLPDDAVPCDATDEENGWIVFDHQPLELEPSPTNDTPGVDFVRFLKSQPEYISQYYAYVDFCDNPVEFYEQLGNINLKFAIASDGGAKPFRGSIGFIIANADSGKEYSTLPSREPPSSISSKTI